MKRINEQEQLDHVIAENVKDFINTMHCINWGKDDDR